MKQRWLVTVDKALTDRFVEQCREAHPQFGHHLLTTERLLSWFLEDSMEFFVKAEPEPQLPLEKEAAQ